MQDRVLTHLHVLCGLACCSCALSLQMGLASNLVDSRRKIASAIDSLGSVDFLGIAPSIFYDHMVPLVLAVIILFISLVFSVTISGPLTRCTKKTIEILTCGCYCKSVALHPERRFVPPYTQRASSDVASLVGVCRVSRSPLRADPLC